MKTIKIKNATRPFGIFLMAMDVRFAYSYGEFLHPAWRPTRRNREYVF